MRIPFLTVVIPTHTRSKLLRRALQSINQQSARENIQIIVVSDFADVSTDNVCHELLRERDIYVVRHGVRGPSASRNLALKLATGQHIMFLDDDDAWNSKFMESLLSVSPNPNFDAVYFNCMVIKESRPESGPVKLGEVQMDLAGRLDLNVFVKNQIHMSCFLFSKALLNGIEFDTTMRAYEDWDYLLSVFERKMPVHMPIMCSDVYEVDDETTDRRGSTDAANNLHAVMDYLYVYRRHAAPNPEILAKRKQMLDSTGLQLPEFLL